MTRGVFITGTDTGVGKTYVGVALARGLTARCIVGSINHPLLTVEAIRMRGLALAGVIINQPSPQVDPAMDNAADLARWLQLPVLPLSWNSATDTSTGVQESTLLATLFDPWIAQSQEPRHP